MSRGCLEGCLGVSGGCLEDVSGMSVFLENEGDSRA